MTRKFSFAAALLVALVPLGPLSSLKAEPETPTITISKSDTISLALDPISGPDGAAITKIVQNDLALSGYFSLVGAGGGGMKVGGSDSGGALSGTVNDHSGGVVLSRQYQGNARARAHAFSADIIETLTGNRSLAGSKIAFVATRTGRKEIYVANYDGSEVRQMTHDGNISVAPALTRDGRVLAYTGYLQGYADIYTIDLASGRRQRIVKFPGTNSGAAFSPDGRRIACTISRDGNPELYVVGANGSGARRLTRTTGVESSPCWSPDGSEIVFSADGGRSPRLFRMSADGGSPRPLPVNYGYATEPDWSPDGRKIAFNIREGGVFKIAMLDLNSGRSRVLTEGGHAKDPVWGPDSRHILFSEGSSLVLLDSQSGRRVRVVEGLGSVSEPTWTH
ncbi:MAG TPA: hypothetical protein VNQ90_15080 [Chthoniobacteraceae bacterium]|nr:hypothetical protein [Chthoniobacteraceae bacterium]